jgi:hypothetical protein
MNRLSASMHEPWEKAAGIEEVVKEEPRRFSTV